MYRLYVSPWNKAWQSTKHEQNICPKTSNTEYACYEVYLISRHVDMHLSLLFMSQFISNTFTHLHQKHYLVLQYLKDACYHPYVGATL